MQAMTAALAALEDNEYYRDQLYQFNKLKDSVDQKLQQLCRSDAPIFDYNLESGNFFLVFAQDTEYVCQLFKKHGIYIRDKSKEIPHAIRILLGRTFSCFKYLTFDDWILILGLTLY
jgi:histidinol-phosphate/aromatic aminotransferase/cobyric acid decarboxylase-like protein